MKSANAIRTRFSELRHCQRRAGGKKTQVSRRAEAREEREVPCSRPCAVVPFL